MGLTHLVCSVKHKTYFGFHNTLREPMLQQPNGCFLMRQRQPRTKRPNGSCNLLLRDQLPEAAIVSVGHRHTLAEFHKRKLQLDAAGGWMMNS